MTRAKCSTFLDRAASALGPVSVKLEFRQDNSQGYRDRRAAGGNVPLLAEFASRGETFRRMGRQRSGVRLRGGFQGSCAQ